MINNFKTVAKKQKQQSQVWDRRHNNSIFELSMVVVYFDQRLGAAHPKCWFKFSFQYFFALKAEKCKTK